MTRRQAREAVFELLFETEFGGERTPEQVLALAREDRDLE
jgi:transcription termination factor NusB